jgi:hypothetical protein
MELILLLLISLFFNEVVLVTASLECLLMHRELITTSKLTLLNIFLIYMNSVDYLFESSALFLCELQQATDLTCLFLFFFIIK